MPADCHQEQSPRRNNPPAAVLALIEMFLKQGVLDGLSRWKPEQGSPQGAVISPLLSNIYLDPLDHLMADQGYEMVRYGLAKKLLNEIIRTSVKCKALPE
jgi:retron-type reverse transcriptase